jgi:hypothetical protein
LCDQNFNRGVITRGQMLRNNQQDLQDEGNQQVESPAQRQQVLPQQIPPPQLPTPNPDRQKLIQKQLVLLLNAHKCKSLDLQNEANGVNRQV